MTAATRRQSERFYAFMGLFIPRGLRTFYRFEATGFEHIPREGGFVLSSNHFSNFDPWVLATPFWSTRRRLRFMAKSELYTWWLTPLLDAAGAFPVRRGEGDVAAFQEAVRLLRAGEIVVVFPQGTRQRSPAIKLPPLERRSHVGAARIARSANVPIVPAALCGTNRLSKLGPIRVAYGPPIDVNAFPGTSRDAAAAATEQLMSTIEELYATL